MYASASDLLTRFGAQTLARRTNRSGVPVSGALLEAAAADDDLSAFSQDEQAAAEACLTVIEEAIQDAQDEIDPYLQSRYDLPLDETPRTLRRKAADLAFYFLHDSPPDAVKDRASRARKFMKDIARGQAELGLNQQDEETGDAGGGVLTSESEATFSSDALAGY